MTVVPLPDVAMVVMGQSPPGSTYNEVGEGLPFFQGKAEFGETSPTPKKWCSAPQRIAEAGDVLVSVRAPVGPTNLAATRCCIGRGLAAIRADAARLDSDYLRFFLRHAEPELASKGQGSTFTAIGRAEIAALRIPLPAFGEQRRMSDLLSRAEGIVRLTRQAQKKATELIPALFVFMFGDPVTNSKSWPLMTLGDLISAGPTNGLYKHQSAYGSGTPILRIDAFYDGRVTDLAKLKRVKIEPDEQRRFAITAGDIIVNRVNSPEYLGKSALVPELQEPTVFESNMMRFSIDAQRALPEFVISVLQDPSSRRHFLANAKHAINQSSINQQDVKSLPVFAPPLALQRQFAQRVASVVAIEQQQQAAMAKAEAVFGSLLAKAFTEPGPQVHREMERALA